MISFLTQSTHVSHPSQMNIQSFQILSTGHRDLSILASFFSMGLWPMVLRALDISLASGTSPNCTAQAPLKHHLPTTAFPDPPPPSKQVSFLSHTVRPLQWLTDLFLVAFNITETSTGGCLPLRRCSWWGRDLLSCCTRDHQYLEYSQAQDQYATSVLYVKIKKKHKESPSMLQRLWVHYLAIPGMFVRTNADSVCKRDDLQIGMSAC